MGLLIDSSVLIEAEHGRFELEALVEHEKPSDVAISTVTVSELWHGVLRASSRRRKRRQSYVEELIAGSSVLAFDLDCSLLHAEMWAGLEVRGQRIGAHDLMIAATALARGYKLATLNEKEFARIEGLDLADARRFVRSG